MRLSSRILYSFTIGLISLAIFLTNDSTDCLVATVVVACSYNFLYSLIEKYSHSNKYIKIIFSVSYLLSYLLILWVNYVSIKLGSQSLPYMPGDGQSYYLAGLELAETSKSLKDVSLNYVGYPLFLSFIFKMLGSSLVFGLIANMILLFINIYLISKATVLATSEEKNFTISFVLLLLTSQFVATGFMLLKDGFVVFSIALTFYASLNIYNEKSQKTNCAFLLVSVLIMSVFRFTLIWVPVLIFLTIISNNRKFVKYFPLALLVLFAGYYFGNTLSLSDFTFDERLDFALSNQVISSRLDIKESGFVSLLLSGYDNWSLLKKLSFLPITVGIQYITPFDFYNPQHFLTYPYYVISKSYNVFWLIYVGPLALYSIWSFIHRRVKRHSLLSSITFLGVLLYIFPAFIFGGAIPRYAVPFFSLILPQMASCYNQIKQDVFCHRRWRIFYLFYYLIFCLLFVFYTIIKVT